LANSKGKICPIVNEKNVNPINPIEHQKIIFLIILITSALSLKMGYNGLRVAYRAGFRGVSLSPVEQLY